MTPSAYYCWLSERRWLWFLRRRFQPRPDQNYPLVIALLMPFVVAGLAMAAFAVLTAVIKGTATEADPPPTLLTFMYVIIGAVVFTAGVIHWGFTLLVWNQRAARLRSAGQPVATPLRPGFFTRCLLGPLYLLILGVVTPVALLTAVENIRGAARWHGVRTELLARGERLDIHDVIPQPAPDDQNFFATPPFNQFFIADPAGGLARIYNTNAAAEFRPFRLPESKLPREARDGRVITVAEWAAALRVALSNQSQPNWRDDQLPRYATPPPGADDATVVLTATSIAEAGLATFCEASHRPRAVFPVPWDDGFNAILVHLAPLKGLHSIIDVRVAAKLAKGDTAGAFADAECSLRLANVLHEEPMVISQLVRVTQYALAERTLWRGIAAHAWNDAQLAAFQQQLAQPDFIGGMAYALEGERAFGLSDADRWVANRRALGQAIDGSFGFASLMPSGWLRQHQAALALYYQHLLDATRSFATNPPAGGYLDPLRQLKGQRETQLAGIRNILVRMLVAALSNAVDKAIQAQANAVSAFTGCALERYRLQHGAYPETLAALVPDFLPAVPLDPMDHQPLRYARSSDGLFRLWSVGENGKDDGGVSYAPEDKKKSRRNLDWVWPFPMP